jgi:hypothetical protein
MLAKAKFSKTATPNTSCRTSITAKSIKYELRTVESRAHLYVFVQLVNNSDSDVSDPVIRIEAIDLNGGLKDTFIRTFYGANIEPHRGHTLRVEGDTILDKTPLKEVTARIESAACKSAW